MIVYEALSLMLAFSIFLHSKHGDKLL
ncbi:putative holin-like toxin [Paenibacillus zeirhizosphaerae]